MNNDHSIRQWAQIGARIALTGFAIWLVYILTWVGWEKVTEHQRIWYLGVGLLMTIFYIGIDQAALSGRNIRGTGPRGLGFSVQGDDDDEAVHVTVGGKSDLPPAGPPRL